MLFTARLQHHTAHRRVVFHRNQKHLFVFIHP
jgi:hypothetical protein